MNLHGIISGSVGAINPQMMVSYYACTATITAAPGGPRTPSYAPAQQVLAQVQELTNADLKHLDDLNMSGLKRKLWSSQLMNGIDRAAGLGGDKVVLPDGTTWLVVQILEKFPTWNSAVIVKQVTP
jgi:hypothetical protein